MGLLSRVGDWISRSRGGPIAFELGDPESVLDNDPAPYLGTFLHEQRGFYEPPIDKKGLAKIRKANGFHSRMPAFRRDKVLNLYELNNLISRKELGRVLENLLVTGDTFIAVIYNAFQQVIGLYCLPSVYMRVMDEGAEADFCYVHQGQIKQTFLAHEVIHIQQDDLLQGIYGEPEYFGAVQSVLLNEAATLFRRKYFINGAHLGSLFISTSQSLKPKDEKLISDKIRQSKGLGNFRSMFLHLPGMQKATDAFNVVPVGDVATRDEFEKIKNITDRDISAAWGTRPEVAGIMPEAYGGTGDLEKLHALDFENKTLPLINLISEEINVHLRGHQHLSFSEPKPLIDQN